RRTRPARAARGAAARPPRPAPPPRPPPPPRPAPPPPPRRPADPLPPLHVRQPPRQRAVGNPRLDGPDALLDALKPRQGRSPAEIRLRLTQALQMPLEAKGGGFPPLRPHAATRSLPRLILVS